VTVRQTIEKLNTALGANAEVVFNNAVREGDPRFYHADIGRAKALNWTPKVSLETGIKAYAAWLNMYRKAQA